MAAHQMVDVDVHPDVGVLLQIADMGVVAVGGAVDHGEFGIAEQLGAVADVRVFGDAALELVRGAGFVLDLADQIDPRQLAVILAEA